MPRTYEQDGLRNEAIAYLHYFNGNMDFYITEKDTHESEQWQAYGVSVRIDHDSELGYISIADLLDNGFEIDLYFTPTKIGEIS